MKNLGKCLLRPLLLEAVLWFGGLSTLQGPEFPLLLQPSETLQLSEHGGGMKAPWKQSSSCTAAEVWRDLAALWPFMTDGLNCGALR